MVSFKLSFDAMLRSMRISIKIKVVLLHFAQLLRRPPTDYNALDTALRTAQGTSAVGVGPHCKAVTTLDLDMYDGRLSFRARQDILTGCYKGASYV
jgi:hypothetical protein